jgi:hypothetical protein
MKMLSWPTLRFHSVSWKGYKNPRKASVRIFDTFVYCIIIVQIANKVGKLKKKKRIIDISDEIEPGNSGIQVGSSTISRAKSGTSAST